MSLFLSCVVGVVLFAFIAVILCTGVWVGLVVLPWCTERLIPKPPREVKIPAPREPVDEDCYL